MATTLRAALSIVLLGGFYVVAVSLLVALVTLSFLAFEEGSSVAGIKAALVALVATVGIVVALWRVARAEPGAQPGIVVTPQDAPELWAMVAETAGAADTRTPDEIRLVPEVNAAVAEDARLLGLLPGPRRLYVGVPLLMGLDVARFRSVLAHEMGHYSRNHTRLSPIAYRGQEAILATVDQLSGNVVGWLLKQYAKGYVLVSAGVTRRQELEADELSVRMAGREVAQSALEEIPLIDAAWSCYEAAYLAPGWDIGLAPTSDAFFAGFAELLGARREELDRMRADGPPAEQSRWDTHPSIAARVAAMAQMPDHEVPADRRPATVLVPDLAAAATRLAEQVVLFGDRRRVAWSELTASAAAAAEQRAADVVLRAAGRAAGTSEPSLGTVLDLVAAGRGEEILRQLGVMVPDASVAGEPEAGSIAPPTLAEVVSTVVGASAVRAGAAHWRHSWSGAAELVDREGSPLGHEALGALAADPATVVQARERLARIGVDADGVGAVGQGGTAHGAEVLGGLANLEVDGTPHDTLVLDRGLVMVPSPKKKEGGKARLVELVGSASVVELAETHRYLAFEDVATATVHKRTPARVDLLLHDGRTVSLKESWTGELLTKESSTILVAVAEDLRATAVVR